MREKVVVDGSLLLFEARRSPRAIPPKGELMSLPELCIRRPVMTSC